MLRATFDVNGSVIATLEIVNITNNGHRPVVEREDGTADYAVTLRQFGRQPRGVKRVRVDNFLRKNGALELTRVALRQVT